MMVWYDVKFGMRVCVMELGLRRAKGVKGENVTIFISHNLRRCVAVFLLVKFEHD